MTFSTIESAIKAITEGKFVVVVDDESRENEGDLIIAAEKVTPEAMAFLVRHSSGVVCVGMEGRRLDQLNLPLMVARNNESHQTAFTVSVDYLHGTTTGISASDRSATVRALTSPATVAADFARPGHIFPLRAKEGGVLRRPGHTEAAADLARLAGLQPAGVLCEIVSADGSMARRPELENFAREHGLPIITIADLIAYRKRHEPIVEHQAQSQMPTRYGMFTAHVFRGIHDDSEHLALVMGDVAGKDNVLVRVHSECLTGDLIGSLRCDCGSQLDLAMRKIAEEGQGVLVYLRGHEGRGIGLAHKMRAYQLQESGHDTVEANRELGLPVDSRSYAVGARILNELGLGKIRLMSNNPVKLEEITSYALQVVERVPLIVPPTKENQFYLETKRKKLGHLLLN